MILLSLIRFLDRLAGYAPADVPADTSTEPGLTVREYLLEADPFGAGEGGEPTMRALFPREL